MVVALFGDPISIVERFQLQRCSDSLFVFLEAIVIFTA